MKKRVMAFLLALVMTVSTPVTVNAAEIPVGDVSDAIILPEKASSAEEEIPVEEIIPEEETIPEEKPSEEIPSEPTPVVETPAEEIIPEEEILPEEETSEEELLEEKEEEEELLKAVKEGEEAVVSVTAITPDGEYALFNETKDPENETTQVEFAKWDSAIAFINKQNKKYDYTISLYDDISLPGNLTLPTKAKKVVIETNDHQISIGGNITLNTDLDLPYGINPTKGTATINLNNHQLTVLPDDVSMFSIKGVEANSAVIISAHDRYKLGKLDINKLVSSGSVDLTFTGNANIKTIEFNDYNEIQNYGFNIKEGVKLNITKAILFSDNPPAPGCISVARVDDNGDYLPINDGELICTVPGSVNTSIFRVFQAAGVSDADKYIAYRDGINLLAGKVKFIVSEGYSSPEEGLKCATWKDVITTINSQLVYVDMYKIYTSEDIVFNGPITVPSKKKCEAIIISGNGNNTVYYKGDLSVTGFLGFENITLSSTKAKPKLLIGDNQAGFNNVKFEQPFASISGTGFGTLELYGRTVLKSEGSINVPVLLSEDSTIISEKGSITFTKGAQLSATFIEAYSSVTFNELYSMDLFNRITYGQTSKDRLTIKGKVNDKHASEDLVLTLIDKKDKEGNPIKVKVSDNAINVLPRFLTENNFANAEKYLNKDIVYTKYGAPCMFVIGRSTTNVRYTLKRVNDALRIDTDSAIKQVEVLEVRGKKQCTWGTYDTVKEAFAAIDRMGSKNADYLVKVGETGDVASTSAKENLVTPKNANSVIIEAVNANQEFAINNSFTLNSNLILRGLKLNELRDKKGNLVTAAIKLNNYKLTLDKVEVPDGRISSVVGANVNGNSAFELIDCGTVILTKDIDKVGTLILNTEGLSALGKINVGNIQVDSAKETTLVGTAVLTVKKVKGVRQLTKVASNITVANEIKKANSSAAFNVGLLYKSGKDYILLGDSDVEHPTFDEYDSNLLNPKNLSYQIVKGPRLRHDSLEYGDNFVAASYETPVHYAKNGGLYIVDDSMLTRGYQLGTITDYDKFDYAAIDSYATYKEAIDAIDIRNDKNATYVISKLTDSDKPEVFAMPKAGKAKAIYVSPSENIKEFTFTKANPTLTCDLYLDGVTFTGLGKTSINLGTNKLVLMNDAMFTEGIKSIKGAGCTKKNGHGELNGLVLKNMTNLVLNSLTDVGCLKLNGASIMVSGTTTMGILETEGNANYFYGGCTVKTSGKKVTAISSNTTINTGIVNENEGSKPFLGSVVLYNGECVDVDNYISEKELDLSKAYKSKTPIVSFLKAKKNLLEDFSTAIDSESIIIKKSNGVFTYYVNYYDPDYSDEW